MRRTLTDPERERVLEEITNLSDESCNLNNETADTPWITIAARENLVRLSTGAVTESPKAAIKLSRRVAAVDLYSGSSKTLSVAPSSLTRKNVNSGT